MHAFQILEYAAWAISILLGLWMLFDLIRTNRAYSEDLLLSSQEGDCLLYTSPSPRDRS